MDINSITTNINDDFDESQLDINELTLIITILIVVTNEIEFDLIIYELNAIDDEIVYVKLHQIKWDEIGWIII